MANVGLNDLCPDIPFLTTQDNSIQQLCLQRPLQLAQSVLAVSTTLQNDQCSSSVLPFFCNASDSLCGEGDSVDLSAECEHIRDNDCVLEWRLLENFINISIPDCQSFTEDGNLTFSRAPQLTCPDRFDLFCDTFCLPVCSEFSLLHPVSHDYEAVGKILQILFQGVGIVGGLITLITCILNRKTM